MRWLTTAAVVLCGCGASTGDVARVDGASSLEEVVAGPLSEQTVRAAAAVIADLPAEGRPHFQPALHEITTAGRRGRDLAEAYRRQFREALNIAEQTGQWRSDAAVAAACGRHGIAVEEFARTLMRIGCAHHAAEVGGRVDLGGIRARTKTQIASLCDRVDAAGDELTRRTLCNSLSSAVALDTYLTLLDRVPQASEDLVAERRAELSEILPKQAAMDIRPVVR